ncbi:hypothetical protein [Streptomyces sp. NPDC059639]|uniref:hypothetical protein n=1 Tax=Streptomyces sp. NPDC059639 TaxID=3346891 RepID=UPI003693F646
MTDIERNRKNALQHDPDTHRDETAATPDRDLTRGTETTSGVPVGSGTEAPRTATTGGKLGDKPADTGLSTPAAAPRPPSTPPPAPTSAPAATPAPTPAFDKTVGPAADEPGPLVAGTEGHERSTHHRDHDHDNGHGTTAERLVPTGTHDELSGRLRQAVTGFVDQPRAAVEEADQVLEDLTAQLAETLAGRHRTLRTSWQESADDTERLRLALRDYRETAEKLLNL